MSYCPHYLLFCLTGGHQLGQNNQLYRRQGMVIGGHGDRWWWYPPSWATKLRVYQIIWKVRHNGGSWGPYLIHLYRHQGLRRADAPWRPVCHTWWHSYYAIFCLRLYTAWHRGTRDPALLVLPIGFHYIIYGLEVSLHKIAAVLITRRDSVIINIT